MQVQREKDGAQEYFQSNSNFNLSHNPSPYTSSTIYMKEAFIIFKKKYESRRNFGKTHFHWPWHFQNAKMNFPVWSVWQRNWVFATNSDFLITISSEPNAVDLRYFKLWILLDERSLKYQRFTPSGGKNIGINKSEFVTKTQFICLQKFKIFVKF